MTLSHGDDATRSFHSVDGGAWGSDDDAGEMRMAALVFVRPCHLVSAVELHFTRKCCSL